MGWTGYTTNKTFTNIVEKEELSTCQVLAIGRKGRYVSAAYILPNGTKRVSVWVVKKDEGETLTKEVGVDTMSVCHIPESVWQHVQEHDCHLYQQVLEKRRLMSEIINPIVKGLRNGENYHLTIKDPYTVIDGHKGCFYYHRSWRGRNYYVFYSLEDGNNYLFKKSEVIESIMKSKSLKKETVTA